MLPKVQLAIIGGGTAGITALISALENNVESVALIEDKPQLGGECAFNACVPTKVMLTAAKYHQLAQSGMQAYGVKPQDISFDFETLTQKVTEVIEAGDYPFLKDKRVIIYHGRAQFKNSNTLLIQQNNSSNQPIEQTLNTEKIIIATGSVPRPLILSGLNELGYLTFQQATHLTQLPNSIIIIGAGPVGVEFAYFFAALNKSVYLLNTSAVILPNEEPEVQAGMQAMLETLGVQIFCNVALQSAQQGPSQQKQILFEHQGQTHTASADEILSAIGMVPNLAHLNLDAVGIETSPKGITVNTQLQTNVHNIWAIGDVIPGFHFTHVADYQAELATKNALLDQTNTVNYQGLGWGIYTNPGLAHVGFTEQQARETGVSVQTVICQAEEVSRYRITSETQGFIKLIINTQTQALLGAHLFGYEVDDMAHLLMLGIRQKLTCKQLLDLIYIYPTKAQLVQKALEKALF